MNRAVISAGSNIKPKENIEKAARWLGNEQKILAKTAPTKTKPEGFTDQPDFLNCAFYIETGLDEKELKKYLEDVERRLGRQKTENKNGPRSIDLDIIVFNGAIVSDDFYKYDFVKNAVLELLPDLMPTVADGIDEQEIEKHFRDIMMKGLKIDITDPNFAETPQRVARMYAEMFSGMHQYEEEINTLFKACFPTAYKGIVAEKGITVFSMCPHHFLPVRYKIAVGYIPNKCEVGLSKLARVIEILAKKPMLQESFTQEIVNLIHRHVQPLGVICVVEGQHYCMQMRGAKQKDIITKTSAALGTFLTTPEMEMKFYQMIKDHEF